MVHLPPPHTHNPQILASVEAMLLADAARSTYLRQLDRGVAPGAGPVGKAPVSRCCTWNGRRRDNQAMQSRLPRRDGAVQGGHDSSSSGTPPPQQYRGGTDTRRLHSQSTGNIRSSDSGRQGSEKKQRQQLVVRAFHARHEKGVGNCLSALVVDGA